MEVKIVLTIRDIKIELTTEELKQLRKILDELDYTISIPPITKEVEFVPYPVYPNYPCEPTITYQIY